MRDNKNGDVGFKLSQKRNFNIIKTPKPAVQK